MKPEKLLPFLHLRCKTEYSFRFVYGPLAKVLAATTGPLAITDRHGSWGHVAFNKAMHKAKRPPIFGAELAVVKNALLRERQPINYMTFLARSNDGLRQVYQLISRATQKEFFYYQPRLDYTMLYDLTDDVIILSGQTPIWDLLPLKRNQLYIEISPNSNPAALKFSLEKKFNRVASVDNFYPTLVDRPVYEVMVGRNRDNRTTPMHLIDRWAMELYYPRDMVNDLLKMNHKLAGECKAELPMAKRVAYNSKKSLKQLCLEGAKKRQISLTHKVYNDRLQRELHLIKEKDFEDYFYVIADMVHYAKQHMLVGPARGSSCGSLVCYLLGITDIDPLTYNLLFERFIDLNRIDLPDIDIDFQDDRREMVFDYIRNKYGADCVARLGTISRYKAKSAISDVSKELHIPLWEINDLKNAIVERSGGDARASLCILDTFNELDIGKATLAKYPQLRIAAEIEGHARHSGQHAAGIVITADAVNNYCSVDGQTGAAQIDKYDVDSLNMLKIDALGLRTLSIIQEVLDTIGKTKDWLVKYPVDDKLAFKVINDGRFAGIFQFEGYALQSLCQQLTIEFFEDLVSMTALARPGPLHCGGTSEFLARRTGKIAVQHLHPCVEHITKDSYGVVIYQEQVMQIAREMGELSWEDVSQLRKAMSKSLGKEFFDQYWDRFKVGAAKKGIKEEEALHVWEHINTMGSWAFNRSHAVAYGMVSYWCLVLKAHYPLEFASASLRNSPLEEKSIKLLRELTKEGYQYKSFDRDKSLANWSVQDGVLIGGLTGIKGVGEKLAADILLRRKKHLPYTNRQEALLTTGTTAWDIIFEGKRKFKELLANPGKYNIHSKIWSIENITSDLSGDFVFLGRLKEKNLRDHNETGNVAKRKGRLMKGQTKFLNFVVEDDSGNILCQITRDLYLEWGKPLVEAVKEGDWLLWKGRVKLGFRKVYIYRWRRMEEFEIKSVEEATDEDVA